MSEFRCGMNLAVFEVFLELDSGPLEMFSLKAGSTRVPGAAPPSRLGSQKLQHTRAATWAPGQLGLRRRKLPKVPPCSPADNTRSSRLACTCGNVGQSLNYDYDPRSLLMTTIYNYKAKEGLEVSSPPVPPSSEAVSTAASSAENTADRTGRPWPVRVLLRFRDRPFFQCFPLWVAL